MTINRIKPDFLAGLFVLLLFVILTFFNWPLLDNIDEFFFRSGSWLISGNESVKNDDLVIIRVDGRSFDKPADKGISYGQIFQKLTDILTENGARVIAFTSLPLKNQPVKDLEAVKKFAGEVNGYPQDKKAFQFRDFIVESIKKLEEQLTKQGQPPELPALKGPVILPVTDMLPGATGITTYDSLDASNMDEAFLESISTKGLACFYPQLLKSAAGSGYLGGFGNITPNDISHSVYTGYKGSLVPGLALRMAILYHGAKPGQVKANESEIVIKDLVIPLIKGRMYTPYQDEPASYRIINYEQLASGKEKRSDTKGKIVIVEFSGAGIQAPGAPSQATALLAGQFIEIVNGRAASRPAYLVYIEILAFALLIFIFIRLTSSKGHISRLTSGLTVIVLLIAIVFTLMGLTGLWVKTANMIFGTVLISVFLVVKFDPSTSVKVKSYETSRILGLNLQSQGELDEAFEEFKSLPLDKETKDLIYSLGLEYEKKNMPVKAIELYSYINKSGGFRDLDDRIPLLKASDYTSTMGSYRGINDSSVLSDSSVNTRAMVGRYKIIGQIGKGSMGLVYKAQDPKINRLVAIKTIRFSDEFEEDVIKEIKERFFMEAEIAGKLSHPAIVTIHDVGDDRDLTYMAMEFLEGEDLDKFIKKANLLPVRTVLNIVAQVAEALDFAHRDGVIHRDIKPANVMLLKNGQVKVTDFGIAKAISSSKTKTGVILGTPNYMSPEQIMGQKIDSKSDIFSLGVLFYQLLTGELPFHGDNLSGLLYQITQVSHTSCREYNQRIPKACEQIIDRALAKNPAQRFRTAGQMAHILRVLGEKMDQLKIKKEEQGE